MPDTSTLPDGWGDPTVVPKLIASHMLTTANTYAKAKALPEITLEQEFLTEQIVEITPNTQIIGAALLQVTFADPAWKITRSGICSKNADGMLYQVDVNFPEGTPVWWRLIDVQFASADAMQGMPNLTLVFQHRIVSYLADCWGPLTWPKGKVGSTRAQFVKMLIDKMPSELPKESIGPGPDPSDFSTVIPEINEIQPVAGSSSDGTEIITTRKQALRGAKINKLSAITAGTKITVLGAKPSAVQRDNINTILKAGAALNAPAPAMVAAMYAAMGETALGTNPNTYTGASGSYGVFQTSAGDYNNGRDLAAQAAGFFSGGVSFGNGGAIVLAKAGHAPVQIANAVEVNAVYIASGGNSANPNATGDSYGHQWTGGAATGIAEATAIVQGYNGGDLISGSGGGASTKSDVAQLSRGTDDDPDEDSWSCLQRLASEVNWAIFSSPSPAPGVFGNYLYYMDLPTVVAQKPALYLELSDDGTTWSATDPDTGKTVAAEGVVNTLTGEIDNTSMQQQVTRTIKGKMRRSRLLNSPQNPSTVMFNMFSGWLEFNAGDVFVFHNAGPANDRWIVEDVTCNMLGDLFSQFTLGPPTFPYPEPQAVATGTSKPATTVAAGTAQGAADIAKAALARQKQLHSFHYQDGGSPDRPIEYNILTQNPLTTDCSGFAISCYKGAGLPDPSGNNYDGGGNTGDMIPHCTKVTLGSATPGDLVFYGPSESDTLHVTVYIGNGTVISMGRPGDPDEGPWQQMGPCPPLGIYRSNFVISKGTAQPKQSGFALPTGDHAVAGPATGINGGSGGVVRVPSGGFKGLFS